MTAPQNPSLSSQDPATDDVLNALAEVPDELLVEVLEARGSAHVVISKKFSASHQSFSGPLPPPDVLAEYKSLDPALLGRIVTMAEQEQQHRHSMETGIVQGKFAVDARGQHYAFGISVILSALAAAALWLGHPATAGTIAVTAVVGAIGAFLRKPASKQSNKVETSE